MKRCRACGRKLSVLATGILCGLCRQELIRNGYVTCKLSARPMPDWPECAAPGCRVVLNPQHKRRHCLWHLEAMPVWARQGVAE